MKQLPVNFLNLRDGDNLNGVTLEIQSFCVVPGYENALKTQLIGFRNALFHPVYGADFAAKSDFGCETGFGIDRCILVRRQD